ncbi:unnamed protein product [Fusarium fujikuroi]|nr:unnamed protein product [Fusarium fujikuroi]
MQLPINFASLVVLSTFALTGVSGKCFTSSINWSNKDKAVGHVEAACRGGVFTGVFKPGQRKYLCVRVADNLKWEFAITNQDTRDSFDLLVLIPMLDTATDIFSRCGRTRINTTWRIARGLFEESLETMRKDGM